MKKLTIIIVFLVGIISCSTPTVEESVENPKSFTTIEKQELPKDTIIVSTVNNKTMYVFNKQNEIITQLKVVNYNYVVIHWVWIFILVLLIFYFIITVIHFLSN